MSTDELIAEALRLPKEERERFAEELLSSLEEPEDDVARSWAHELTRRSRDLAEGRAKTIGWDTAEAEVLEDLKRRRDRRST